MASGQRKYVAIAERALGKPLPKGVHIHHVDGNDKNNERSNLVICPSAAYHKILHVRTKALEACSNSNFRKCPYCQKYDDPSTMMRVGMNSGREAYRHRVCASKAYHTYMHGLGKEWKPTLPPVLNKEKGDEIRRLYTTGICNQRQLAEKFGVDQTTISLVVTRKRWI